MKVAVHPLSWTNQVIPEFGWDTPAETYFAEAKEAGYAGVENGRNVPQDLGTLSRLLGEHQLEMVTGWHSGFLSESTVHEELDRIHDQASLLSEIGAKVIVYGECGSMAPGKPLDVPMSRRICLSDINLKEYADKIAELSLKVKEKYGLQLAYHHHLMMIVERQEEIDMFLDEVDQAVGLLFDTGHCVAGGGGLSETLAYHGSRIKHIHLKDVRADILTMVRDLDKSFNEGVRAGIFTVPGDGDIDFSPVTDFISRTGYDDWLTVEAEQDPSEHKPLPTVSRARQYVREVFGV